MVRRPGPSTSAPKRRGKSQNLLGWLGSIRFYSHGARKNAAAGVQGLSGYRHRAFVSGPLPVAVRVPSPNDPVMESAAMVRVYCADGPCQGEQYICLENGTILFDDNPGLPDYIYRTDDNERIGIRNLPIAYFDHTE